MATNAEKALQCETEFLAGVETNFEEAKGGALRGSIWQRASNDEGDLLRALMAKHRNYDRELLKTLPANRRVELHGYERRFLFGKRRTGVAIASVLSPLDHYAASAEGTAPPIGLGELIDHVRRLVTDRKVPYIIGVCSPTGFTEEARSARFDEDRVSLVLIEPDPHGGWQATGTGDRVDPRLVQIFDPEGPNQKVARIHALVEERSADLLTGGISASSVAENANLPEHLVRRGFEQVAAADPELRITRKAGELLLFRGAPVVTQEKKSMNVIDRIKQLLSGEGDTTAKINVLAERRAALAQRRDRMYEDIGKLETKEADLLEQGKAAKSSVPRRRLAAQLAQLRKDIARLNTTASMLNQQINIISTDVHNLTLIQQGTMASLPETDELTEHAVQAEEMLETLKADADLVGSLETDMEQTLASEEELAILREFEGVEEPSAAQQPAAPAQRERAAPPVEESVVRETAATNDDPERKAARSERKGEAAGPEPT